MRNRNLKTTTPSEVRRERRYLAWAVIALLALVLALAGCAPAQQASTPAGSETEAEEAPTQPGQTRTYYIAAEEVDWDAAPSGKNLITGEEFDDVAKVFVERGPSTIGSTYKKALYVEYTDDTFTTKKPRLAEWEHLGSMGPLIQAEVGDTIEVVFKNNASRPYSVHPHGVFYEKDSEGTPYDDGTSGADKADDAVAPGATHTYTWEVPERAGPAEMDPSSIPWMYHSHVDEVNDTNAGLMAPMIVYRKGSLVDGKASDVQREVVTLFTVSDENVSWYLDDNIEKFAGDPESVEADSDEFAESNLMHVINGYVYGNLPLESMTFKKSDEKVRWHLMGMGTEVDLHTPHWHGNTVEWMGMRTDVVELLPMSMKVVDMEMDNAGTWLFHCHVNDHLNAGMIGRFKVE